MTDCADYKPKTCGECHERGGNTKVGCYKPTDAPRPDDSLGSGEFAGYVRCKYCDMDWGQQSGFSWEVLRTKDFGVCHEKAWWDCPACGHKNLSYIFPST